MALSDRSAVTLYLSRNTLVRLVAQEGEKAEREHRQAESLSAIVDGILVRKAKSGGRPGRRPRRTPASDLVDNAAVRPEART